MLNQRIVNPETNRQITVNGPTYQKLIEKGYILDDTNKLSFQGKIVKKKKDLLNTNSKDILQLPKGKINPRGNVTKGWAKDSPRTISQRKHIKEKCGDRCFLSPENMAFPICPKSRCELDCRGVSSAYIRASQWKYNKIKNLAKTIRDKKC